MRERLAAVVNGSRFQNMILALIVLNGVILAIDVLPGIAETTRDRLQFADRVIVWIFIVEIALRILANGRAFFRDGWSLFDFAIVVISAPGTVTGISALRILRALRLLRVLSGVSQLRKVGEALVAAIPGISWVIVLLFLINVVSAIIGTNLFGEEVPEYFGDLFTSMYSLFMVMTLEDWPDIADAVLAPHPMGWIFFVAFILVATFTIMNLFVGVIVAVMDRETSTYYEHVALYRDQMRRDMEILKGRVERILDTLEEPATPDSGDRRGPEPEDGTKQTGPPTPPPSED